jgi:RNA polymerase sigma-70 factor (ECF subfamily)
MRNQLEFEEGDHPALFTDLEKQILNSDRVRRVKLALEQLSENQRSVIELAYFEGLSQTEIAARLAQPLGTVKTWSRAALKALRESLGMAVPA